MRFGSSCSSTGALTLFFACAAAFAQPKTGAAESVSPAKPLLSSRSTPDLAVATPASIKSEAGPAWGELNSEQQAALRPLAASWTGLNAYQKRKWIALSRNHGNLSPDERTRLHERMSTWAALSPAERTQARLNFSESRERSAQDKSAQWEAYQGLPPEQKKELARQQPAKPSGASIATTGLPKQKLVPAPDLGVDQAPRLAGHRRAKPKLMAGDNVDANTLLPQQP